MYNIPNNDDILTKSMTGLILSYINEIPAPTQCTITQVHSDGTVDIHTKTYGELKYIDTITEHEIGDKSVLLFLNQSLNERIII